ncbi:MAG: leucyl aminopeptidase [Actinobacteria bacterium]|jgi:leucyl aminopeptidase|nr:leucyl aminopeptidase [Actinomycetota bacterium]MCL6095410.1 leucyl aminopeptidase [Actinomycetota bacterium]
MSLEITVGDSVPDQAVLLGIPVFEGEDFGSRVELLRPPDRVDTSYIEKLGFTAKLNETLVLTMANRIYLLVGLGAREDFSLDTLRRGGAVFGRSLHRISDAALVLPRELAELNGDEEQSSSHPSWQALVQTLSEGMLLAAYSFTSFKSHPEPEMVQRIKVVLEDSVSAEPGLSKARLMATATCRARDWVNEPAASMTPVRFADIAVQVAQEAGLSIEVWDEKRIEEEGLGGLLGVASGSARPPRLIKLVYDPKTDHKTEGAVNTVALVGKGITFDSGGLSLKSQEGMATMKTDMAGAAAVLAAMSVLAELGIQLKVVGILPVTENMPSGTALKPGDVLKMRSGKTVEVLNTDAEGRLILADALALAAEEDPTAIIDLATLTGACVVALGPLVAGLMGNTDWLCERLETAAERAGEPLWRLPLPRQYKSHLLSDIADLKNIGKPGGQAGALVAGLFLEEFIDGKPWAHLDIAGPARSSEVEGVMPKGATGFGARTLLELLSTWSNPEVS